MFYSKMVKVRTWLEVGKESVKHGARNVLIRRYILLRSSLPSDLNCMGTLSCANTARIPDYLESSSICPGIPVHHPSSTQAPSMHEPEVIPLRPFICRVANIVHLLLSCQLSPGLFSPLVPCNIVVLGSREQHDVETADGEQDLVPSDVVRPIIIAIDVGADNVSGLDEHVVQRCADCSSADRVRIARVPGDKYGVAVWVGEQTSEQSVADPSACTTSQSYKRSEPG